METRKGRRMARPHGNQNDGLDMLVNQSIRLEIHILAEQCQAILASQYEAIG